jgi:peptidoglycan/LPS O-acetylase OafA/YrhL
MPIRKYFDNINLLRGFAVITVVIYHFIEINKWQEFPTSGLLLWFRAGWMAVDLFFVISGFVVGLAIFFDINSTDKLSKKNYRKLFLINRFARIIPLYLLTLSISLIFINPNLIFDHLLKNIFLHVFFLQNLFPEYRGALNGVTWSLAPEVQFYLFLLLFSPFLLRVKIIYLAIMFIGGAWFFRGGLFSQLTTASSLWGASTNIFGVIDEFGVGFILSRIYCTPWGEKLFKSNPINLALWLFLSLVVGYICQSIYWNVPDYYGSINPYTFLKTLLAISFGLLVLFFCSLRVTGIYRIALVPFYYLGTISYGIYLWHLPILASINRVVGVPPIYQLAILLIISILAASISWHFFEKPIIDKCRKFQKSH